jgi:exportin-1
VLTQFKEHAEAWSKVDQILEQSQSQATKFFALQILEDVVKYRWNALPREQCDGIRNFIVDKVITNSSTEESLRSEKLYLDKLNIVLVQVLSFHQPVFSAGLN